MGPVHARAADDVPVTVVDRPSRAGGAADGVLALQRSAGNRVTRRVLARQERRRRDTHETLLDRMVAGMTLDTGRRGRLLAAVRSFTVGQLRRMVDAGVRFWGPTGVPPALAGIVEAPEVEEDAQAGARASYVPTARFIRVRRGSGTQEVVHELAHAWDNVRTGRLTPLRRLLGARDPVEALAAEAERTEGAMWTAARTRHATQDENGRRVRLTIAEMLQRYRARRVLRENRFGTPSAREGYSMLNAREFYAEGYAVFHAGDAEQRTRLREQAPELYHLLAREAAAARR